MLTEGKVYIFLNPFNNTTKTKNEIESLYKNQKPKRKNYSVLPTILRVDIGAGLDKALGDEVDLVVEGGDVERSAVVVVSGLNEAAIFF